MINLRDFTSGKTFSLMIALLLIITSFSIVSSDDRSQNETINTGYSSSQDTIYVKGEGNTLQSVESDIDDEEVFYYDGMKYTAYCYANLTIEGQLLIEDENLLMDDRKNIRVNSTGELNISHSVVEAIKEEKRWWDDDNRFSVKKMDQGNLTVDNTTIQDIGWGDESGEKGLEVYGPGLNMVDSTLKEGRIGLIFDDCGDVSSEVLKNLTITDMDDSGIVIMGTSTVRLSDSILIGSQGSDVKIDGTGELDLVNSSYEDYDVSGEGELGITYNQDFRLTYDEIPISNSSVEIFRKGEQWSENHTTDADGRINNLNLTWRRIDQSGSYKMNYGIRHEENQTYFSPSNYNRLNIDFSKEERLYLTNVSLKPGSFVPVNNSLDPQNITIVVEGKNDLSVDYQGNITFYWQGDGSQIKRSEIDVLPGDGFEVGFDWVPDVDGYEKVRADLESKTSMSEDNLRSWSEVFFAGYYNESIDTYEDLEKISLKMMEHGVRNEDGDGYYTVYENWLPDVLMECGLSYYGAYEVTGNYSYFERGRKQFDHALGFRDQWGLYNRSTSYEVRGRFKDTYHEWSTHRNVRAALALQQAYLYTRNETYRQIADTMIEFIVDKAARINITYHNGTEYQVFWESTEPNGGNGGVKGASKNFSFLFVNGYIQLGRLLTQAYYDEDINSTYHRDDGLLTHINTCVRYIIEDQIDSGDSKGTWAYFSYYDEPDPWRRRSMIYAALTAKELTRTNTYLQWDNISETISRYTSYVEQRLELRSAVDIHNGGSANIMIYNHWRSLYKTTDRNFSKIEDFMFSNIFFNEDGTTKSFTLTTDRGVIDPEVYGFLYVHYNPFRTVLWDRYHENRSKTVTLDLEYQNESHGWNFISSKLVPDSRRLEEILNHPDHGIEGSYDKVIWYDNERRSWTSRSPEREDDFNDKIDINHKKGFWIRMTEDDSLTIQGIRPYTSYITLHPGWNMVGYPSDNIKDASKTLPLEVSRVGWFNSSRVYNLQYSTDLTDCTLEPGNGYWLFNNAEEEVNWKVEYD